MTIINTSPNKLIQIGYEGEDSVTQIVFAYDDTWTDCGDGVFKIRVLRHGDTVAYNATSVTDDREAKTLTMTITDVELSVQGRGEMQVVYSGTDFVKKSPIYAYYVSRALDGEVSPPDGNIITEIVESLADITETIGDMQTAIQHKADTQTVSTIADAVNGLDSDVQGLQTTVQAKADTATVTALSGTVTGLQTNKADKSYVDTELAGKASTATATASADGLMSAQDKSKLDAVYADYTSALTALGGGS